MDKSFQKWLRSDDYELYALSTPDGRSHTMHFFVKVRRSDAFDMIYHVDVYNESAVPRNKPFKYSGIYHKNDHKIYDASYEIIELAQKSLIDLDSEELRNNCENRLLEELTQGKNGFRIDFESSP